MTVPQLSGQKDRLWCPWQKHRGPAFSVKRIINGHLGLWQRDDIFHSMRASISIRTRFQQHSQQWVSLPSAFLLLGAVSVLQSVCQIAEELVPEKGKACGECSLQQAWGETLEESTGSLLPHNLLGTVYYPMVCPHLEKEWTKPHGVSLWTFCIHSLAKSKWSKKCIHNPRMETSKNGHLELAVLLNVA